MDVIDIHFDFFVFFCCCLPDGSTRATSSTETYNNTAAIIENYAQTLCVELNIEKKLIGISIES